MNVQIRYSLRPPPPLVFSPKIGRSTKPGGVAPFEFPKVDPWPPSAPPGVLEYPGNPASLWRPPIEGCDCLILGAPWGAWNQATDVEATLNPRTDREPEAPFLDEDERIDMFTDLILNRVVEDTSIWSWASRPNRTLIWIIPSFLERADPRPEVEQTITFLAMTYFMKAMGDRVSQARFDASPGNQHFQEDSRALAGENRWINLLGPMRGDFDLVIAPRLHVPRTGVQLLGNSETGLTRLLDDLRPLDSRPGHPQLGTALVGRHAEGCVVFLPAKHPEDEEEVSQLTAVATAIHQEVWTSPGAPSSQGRGPQAGRDSLEHQPVSLSAPRGNMALKELVKFLSEKKFGGQDWTYHEVRGHLRHDETGAFADLAKCKDAKNGKFRRGQVMGVLEVHDAYFTKEKEQAKQTREALDRNNAAERGDLS